MIRDLQVCYGRAAAVKGVSLEVNAGEAVCIVGPNGAGKSSTLLAVAGVLKFSGRIEFDGRSIAGMAPENVCRLGISMTPEGRGIFPGLTVEENLMLGTVIRRDRDRITADRDDIFERFAILKERRRANAGKLSGGEQQQLAIARALMTRPKLILIDEPSLGLAPMMVAKVYEFLSAMRREGMTMLIIEQNVSRALSFTDRIYVLREGSVQLAGRTADLRASRKALEEAYFGFGPAAGARAEDAAP